MILKIKNKKIPIKEYKTWKERLKVLKFDLNVLDYAIYFPKKKYISTYFFCQRVDICFTDRTNKILFMHENVKSEKRIYHPSAKNIWILPLGSISKLKVGEKLQKEKEE
ncbi:MAG: hypothetical protein IKF71_01815 [Bacilli bacterium]|nr:hypothetical protein [Bacilli bacterium]